MWDEPKRRRNLGIRDRQILWERAKHKCQACGKKIDYTEMQVGHKTAYSKGGSTTLRNSVCLCYKCNKLQGTDSWSTFLKKLGKSTPSNEAKTILKTLTVTQLKQLAKKHNITVRGKKVEGFFDVTIKPPTKAQYVNTIARKVSIQQIKSFKKNIPATPKRKKKQSTKDDWFF
jgi:hypothetical protein